jgi:GxxExxY protein
MMRGNLERDSLTEKVIGLGIEVHRALGPGLLESAYERCLAYELTKAGIHYHTQVILPLVYKEIELDSVYRLDILVESRLIIEVKTVEKLLPIHEAQLLSYLRIAKIQTGLLMNFHSVLLKDGIKRMVL